LVSRHLKANFYGLGHGLGLEILALTTSLANSNNKYTIMYKAPYMVSATARLLMLTHLKENY